MTYARMYTERNTSKVCMPVNSFRQEHTSLEYRNRTYRTCQSERAAVPWKAVSCPRKYCSYRHHEEGPSFGQVIVRGPDTTQRMRDRVEHHPRRAATSTYRLMDPRTFTAVLACSCAAVAIHHYLRRCGGTRSSRIEASLMKAGFGWFEVQRCDISS